MASTDTSRGSLRLRLAAVALLLVPLGIGTKLYAGPGASWVAAHGGGLVYVMFWTLVVLAFRPGLASSVAAGAVFLVTCALEFLQLWHPPALEAVRGTALGRALVGSSFAWSDFPYYALGALMAVATAHALDARSSRGVKGGSG